MLLLAFFGCRALASQSGWKGESDLESNDLYIYGDRWKHNITSWMLPERADFDPTKFLDAAEKILGTPFRSRKITTTKFTDVGKWIRGTADEMVLAAYWHSTKNHTAYFYRMSFTFRGTLPKKRTIAPPGRWAIAFGNPGNALNTIPMYEEYD